MEAHQKLNLVEIESQELRQTALPEKETVGIRCQLYEHCDKLVFNSLVTLKQIQLTSQHYNETS